MNKPKPNEPIKSLTEPSGTLSHRIKRGVLWVFSLRMVQQIFNFVRLIILARILSPNDFGLMGIAMLTLSILETFTQTGFNSALVQKKGDIKLYLDDAWTVTVIRGIILFMVVYIIAPYSSMFFDKPEAKAIIQVFGISIILKSFTNIGVAYFQKELEFNKRFTYELTGTLTDFVVTISFVLILKNIWALVFGHLAGDMARCIGSYCFHTYRPRFILNFEKVKELWNFGKWVFGSSILIFLTTQGDDIFVGKLLGATALGFYQVAYRISNMPSTEITHIISEVTFPAYSKMQDDLPRLREAYLKVLQLTAFLSFPVAGLIFVLAPDFTKIFLGDKWMPMVPAMQGLVIWGLSRSVVATTGPLFSGVGKPQISTWLQLAKIVLIVVFIYPFTILWGIAGTALALVGSALLIDPICIYIAARILYSRIWKPIKAILIPAVGVLIMLLCIETLGKLTPAPKVMVFLGFIFLGLMAYVTTIVVIDKRLFSQWVHYDMDE